MTRPSQTPQHTLPVHCVQWFFGSLMMLPFAITGPPMAASFVDAMVAQVDLYTIAASDIALARALGLYGLPPAKGPIRAADIDRFIDGRLIVAEAERLGITPPPEVLDKEWREVVARRGGTKQFQAWLEEKGISRDWAKRLTNNDAQRKHFTELRFERFVFIPEEEITRALGPGSRDSDGRERIREALRKRQAERELERWLEGQRKRAKIRRFTAGEIPDPLNATAPDDRQS